MAQFKYTLPSGAEYTLDTPAGTTQAQADKVFYSQVAAGAFVGYRAGDTLTHPATALANFGLTREQRGTAGVDDQTLLAVINGLPIVAPVPNLLTVPIENPINTADYINNDPGLGPNAIGSLSAVQVKALMAQVAATTNQAADTITQEVGAGKYGLNCEQLEKVVYVKPGTADRYFNGASAGTQPNPDNFVEVMSSPTVWTGVDGVTSLDVFLANEAIQNQAQQILMENSYNQLVQVGAIVPPNTANNVPASEGQVYSAGQSLVAASALTLVATALGYNGSNPLFSDFKNILSGSPTNILTNVQKAGGDLTTLANGAIDSVTNAGNTLAGAYNGVVSSVNGQVGALVATASKYGTQATALWTSTTTTLSNLPATAQAALANFQGQATATFTNVSNQATALQASASAAMDKLGKASLSSINFSDFSLSGLVAGIQPGAAFNNTVDRQTVDQAMTRFIGSDKITIPSFELPNLASLGTNADIAQAQNILKSAQESGQAVLNQGQNLYNQGQAAYNQASQLAQSLQAQGTNTFGQITAGATTAKRLLG